MTEVYCGQVLFSYLQYFLRYELFSPISVKYFGQVQTDRQTTDRKWRIRAHRATCTGGLKNVPSVCESGQLLDHVVVLKDDIMELQ